MNDTNRTKIRTETYDWQIERYKRIIEQPALFNPSLVGLEKGADKYATANTEYDRLDRGIEIPKEIYRLTIALFVEQIANDAMEDLDWFIDRFPMGWEDAERAAHRFAEDLGFPIRQLTPSELEDVAEMETCATCGQALDYQFGVGFIPHKHD